MTSYSNILNEVSISNNYISEFADSISQARYDGGLFNYTTNNEYRKNNLFNNYNGGKETRNPYVLGNKWQYFKNDEVKDSNIISERIGEGYAMADKSSNSNLKFMTEDKFLEFEKTFREKMMSYNRETSEYEDKYGSEFFVTSGTNGEVSNEVYKLSDTIVSGKTHPVLKTLNEEYINKHKCVKNSDYKGNEKVSFGDLVNIGTRCKFKFSTEEYSGGSREKFAFDSKNNTRKYSYFLENENGTTPSSVFSRNVSDGNTVLMVTDSEAKSYSPLLQKTKAYFKNGNIKSLINRFHTQKDSDYAEYMSSYSKYGLSRGRNLLTKSAEEGTSGDKTTGYDNPYCRVWTAHHQYSHLKDRIRPFYDEDGNPMDIAKMQENYGALRPNSGNERLSNGTVLTKEGFVRITPYETYDTDGQKNGASIKNCMFSIENLAWKDVKDKNALSAEQRGPNDGRIMWFPPYNLKFSEQVNTQWNSHDFIGRGEKIYTYTNTERTGNLSFTLLIDHPSIINKWRGRGDISGQEKVKLENDLLRYFAGCGNLEDFSVQEEVKEKDTKNNDVASSETKPTFNTKDIAYVVFFPNDFSGYDYFAKKDAETALGKVNKYEGITGNVIFTERDDLFKNEDLLEANKKNHSSYQLNDGGQDSRVREILFNGDKDIEIHYLDDFENIKNNFSGSTIFGYPSTKCEISGANVKGFASSHGTEENNIELCRRRKEFMKECAKSLCAELSNVKFNDEDGQIISVKDIDNTADVNTLDAKIARAGYLILHIKWSEDNTPSTDSGLAENGQYGESEVKGVVLDEDNTSNYDSEPSVVTATRVEQIERYSYDNEYLYFSNLKDSPLVYKSIIDKIKYFDPAFHSITPEGFNARLTFLHQCTRQGPTNAVSAGRTDSSSANYLKYAGNLAFGRAPYCILRIGDFFHTKICIENISIEYDNNGIQWDLNPEGVGVQPMYANVNMSFKFIGGQDISGPIERLQNAVTANYYANASIYDRHSDTESTYYDVWKDEDDSNNGRIPWATKENK